MSIIASCESFSLTDLAKSPRVHIDNATHYHKKDFR